jgi:hypothetical protein
LRISAGNSFGDGDGDVNGDVNGDENHQHGPWIEVRPQKPLLAFRLRPSILLKLVL